MDYDDLLYKKLKTMLYSGIEELNCETFGLVAIKLLVDLTEEGYKMGMEWDTNEERFVLKRA